MQNAEKASIEDKPLGAVSKDVCFKSGGFQPTVVGGFVERPIFGVKPTQCTCRREFNRGVGRMIRRSSANKWKHFAPVYGRLAASVDSLQRCPPNYLPFAILAFSFKPVTIRIFRLNQKMIRVSGLEKTFGEKTIINNLSFSLVAGEILGFLGPNGAGKSTTMKILTGFLKPSAGSVSILGHDVLTDPVAAQKQMGYLPEGAPAYEEMTVLAFLEFIAEIRGFTGQQRRDRITDVVRKMSLQEVLTQKIETLSKGFKRRVGLAQAIIHDPAVLILDEPTDGLDPNQKQQVRALIHSLSKDKIVIISTHILEEVTAVCNRVIIISEGQMVADCSPSALEQESRYHGAVTIRLDNALCESVSQSIRALAEVDSVEVASALVGTSDLTVFGKQGVELYPYLNRYLTQQELVPLGLFQEKGRLDDVFRRFTVGQQTIAEEAAMQGSVADKEAAL